MRACVLRTVVVEESSDDEVVRALLGVGAKGEERRVVLLAQELERRRVLERVHRIVPRKVFGVRFLEHE